MEAQFLFHAFCCNDLFTTWPAHDLATLDDLYDHRLHSIPVLDELSWDKDGSCNWICQWKHLLSHLVHILAIEWACNGAWNVAIFRGHDDCPDFPTSDSQLLPHQRLQEFR